MWDDLHDKLTNPMIQGPLMSMIFAIVRVIYDKKETKPSRIALEALVCGGLSLTAGALIKAMGWNEDFVLFASGAIGFLGAQAVRQVAIGWLNKKASK